MTNSKLSPRSPKRRPSVKLAEKVGGQRRKLTRRSVVSRSNTMPVLPSPNFASSSMAMAAGIAPSFTPGHEAAATPTKKSFPLANDCPKTPTTPVEGKRRRHGLFALKTKERPGSSGNSAGEPSPLPPLTPKAAQILGVAVEDGTHDEPLHPGFHDLSDSEDEYTGQLHTQIDGGSEDQGRTGLRVHSHMLRKRASESLLTTLKTAAGMQTESREDNYMELESPVDIQPAGFFRKSNKKAMRMLDLLPSFNPRAKTAPYSPRLETLPPPHRLAENDIGYSSDSDVRRSLLKGSQPPRKGRSRRKKQAKTLEIPPPITEASQSSGGSIVPDADDPDLDALYTAYGNHRASYSTSSLPKSFTLPDLSRSPYELEQHELSDVDEDKEERREEMVDLSQPIFGAVPNYSTFGRHFSPDTFHVQSPLQKVEHRLLDEAEERLRMSEDEKRRLKQETRKSLIMAEEKTVLDIEVLWLQEDHKKMKREFRDLRTRSIIRDAPIWVTPPTDDEDDEDDDRSYCSICSSIDTDEEPEVCEYELQTVTKVTPGRAKLIDIAPREDTESSSTTAKADLDEGRFICSFKKDDLIGFSPEKKQTVDSPMSAPPALLHTRHEEELEPFPDFYERPSRPKKVNLPREESRLLVQNWVNEYNTFDHARPMSVRFDPDVLAERQVPPAPLPKDGPVPIAKMSPAIMIPAKAPKIPARSPRRNTIKPAQKPPKYHCVHVGHSFRPINLKEVPDNVAIGRLGTPPYLHTSTGVKQHVHVPVMCDMCGKDVKEVFWECEILVCHMALCFDCALMRREDADVRNIDTWKES